MEAKAVCPPTKSHAVLIAFMAGIQAQLDFGIKRGLVPILVAAEHYQAMLVPTLTTGQVIRNALERLGKTQGWLAEQLGVSDNAVSLSVKNGQVSRQNAVACAKVLGVPVGSLLSDENPISALLGEALLAMDEDKVKFALEFLRFNLQNGAAIYDGDKRKQYMAMIESIEADMARRRASDA